MSSRRRRDDEEDVDDDSGSPSHSRSSRRRSQKQEEDEEESDQPSEEELRRQAELDAAKAELFGPRHKKQDSADSGEAEAEAEAGEEELSEGDLLNFDLGELDITTADLPVEFDDVDDDLLQFQSDPLVKEALTKGVDLRLYSHQLEAELGGREQGLLLDYVSHADELAMLHLQVRGCDEVLRRMEEMLSDFKGSIGELSDEIAEMQDKSLHMSTKVENRKVAQRKLSKFLELAYIPPDVLSKLSDGAVDDDYADAIVVLDRHLSLVQGHDFSHAKAMDEVLPQVEKAKRTVTQRIKAHLAAKFAELSACRSSSGVKEAQTALLPLHPLFTFLINQGADSTCDEIRGSYIESVSKVYSNKYKKYWSDVRRLADSSGAEKGDLLAVEERGKQGLFAKKQTGDGMNRLFQLGEREAVLKSERVREEVVDEVIERDRAAAGSAASTGRGGAGGGGGGGGGGKVPFERLWKYGCDLLVESGINEYDFIVGFFGEKEKEKEREEHERKEKEIEDRRSNHSAAHSSTAAASDDSGGSGSPSPSHRGSVQREELYERGRRSVSTHSHDKQIFTVIFQRVSGPFHEVLEAYLLGCHDALSLLLLIRVVTLEMQYLHSLHIYFLDFLFDRMTMTLWPRFKQAIDANIESVKLVPSLIPEGKRSPKEMQAVIAQTHFVVVRYAEYVQSILKLNAGVQQPEDIIALSLKRLRSEVDKLLTRSTVKLTNGKHQAVFQLNNYYYIMTRLSAGDEQRYWQDLYAGQLQLLIEEELYERFRQLITFTKQYAAVLEDGQQDVSMDWAAVEAIVRAFSKSWREGVEGLASSVQRAFEGSSAAMQEEMVRAVLTQLLVVYQKFTELMKKYGRQRQQLMREVIPVNNLLFEVKKYAKMQ